MADKLITLDNLQEFKTKCDETYGSSSGTTLYQHNVYAYIYTTSDFQNYDSIDAVDVEPLSEVSNDTSTIEEDSESTIPLRAVSNSGHVYCVFSLISTIATPISEYNDLVNLIKSQKNIINASGYISIDNAGSTSGAKIIAIGWRELSGTSGAFSFWAVNTSTTLLQFYMAFDESPTINIIDNCINLSDGTSTVNQIKSS